MNARPETLLSAVLDLFYPETCTFCGGRRDGRPWAARGVRVRGLRPWDAPHLCAACADGLGPIRVGTVALGAGRDATVVAAAPADADLVALVGRYKYKGVRGLAWPLARAMTRAAATIVERHGPFAALVAVPLHRQRRRERGFNQSAVLARLVGHALGVPVLDGVLARRRATPRQASLATAGTARDRNVAGAFTVRRPDDRPPAVVLVDDLLTTGATWASAARALVAAGYPVHGGLALGMASRLIGAAPDAVA